MSVVATYARVSEDYLEKLCNDAEWMDVLYGRQVPGAETIDIDKSCDGIIWLLSRIPQNSNAGEQVSSFVLGRNLATMLCGVGGTSENRLETPLGSSSILSVQQVRELSTWLEIIESDQLRQQYNPEAMSSVYPQIWQNEGAAAFDDYLLPQFTRLRKFLAAASSAEQCVIVFFV